MARKKFNHLAPFSHGRFNEIAKMLDNLSGMISAWA
jgi:hypothetical protein